MDEVTKKRVRIFINHVDTFHGKNLSKYLSNCVVGAALEEAEEDEAASVRSDEPIKPKEGTYEVIGTLSSTTSTKPDWVKYIVEFNDRSQLAEHLIECDFVIYDISENPNEIDEASWAIEEMQAELEHWEGQKVFILLSTIMTWAKSKPLDPDDPEIPFTEEDYRRRKPHPNFKNHISCEKTVIKCGKVNKQKLISYVVSAGLTYGYEEQIFHYLFKSAWNGNTESLPVYGSGENVLPTIHLKDLCAVIQNICDSKPKTRYILAVDDSQVTLQEIVKAISTALHNGKIRMVSKEESMLEKDLEQMDFDMLLVNLRMDAVYIKENMTISWHCESGILESMSLIVKEFKESRKLQPMKICILGAPASGKTTLAERLCRHYKIHHVKLADVINESLEKLKKSAARVDSGEDEEEDEGKAQEDSERLEKIMENKTENNGRLDDEFIIDFFKEKLHSKPCQNQGFVLDGYPKTYDQAKVLFAPGDDEEEAEDSKDLSFDKAIMPDYLLALDAPDDFLKERIMNLPEKLIEGTHNTEERLNKRLAIYRELNTEDNTVLNYFDELEVHPQYIDVTKEADSDRLQDLVKKVIGEPRNYGPTKEEQEELEKQNYERLLKKETEEREEKERREAEEAAERKRREEEWKSRLDEVRREEAETLEAKSIPLRNYLMKHVMPTLTEGLIECCKTRPDDAIDYIAEYLFKHNPQID